MNTLKRVYLYVDELLHDIDGELLKFSKLRASEVGNIANEELQSDETDGNRPLILRRIDRHIGLLCRTLQAYLVGQNRLVADNCQHDVSEYEFVLSFPENWLPGLFPALPLEMHSYVVNGVIADFLKSVYPAESAVYDEVSRGSLWNVKHCVTARIPESLRKVAY